MKLKEIPSMYKHHEGMACKLCWQPSDFRVLPALQAKR